jgi:tetratricopeptide (TPR) repeat protein
MFTIWAYANYVKASRVQNPKSKSEERIEAKNIQTKVSIQATRLTTSSRYYILTLSLFILGLMSKPMLVTLPFALLLLDYWPLGRIQLPNLKSRALDSGSQISDFKFQISDFRALLKEKVPFFLAALAASGITFLVQKHGGAMAVASPLLWRIENALVAYCRYLGKLFWPADLAAFYPAPNHWPLTAVWGACALLVTLSVLAFLFGKRHPYVLVGWLWFMGTLVPVIGLVQVGEQSMADRYTYIPSIGIVMILVWGAAELLHVFRWSTPVATVPAVTLALLCIGLTRQQTRYWKDDQTLFGHALMVTKNNHLAHAQLGAAFDRQGRLDEAISEFQEALKERPDYPGAHNNLGIVLDRQGHFDDAIKHYLQEIRINPNYANPHNNLGSTLEKQGRLDDALREYEIALKLKPHYADAHYNRGIALGRKGRRDEAIMEFQAALNIQPNSADAHNNLGVMLDQMGRLDEAITYYQAAIEWKPDYAKAHFNLGVAWARKGQLDDAQREFELALRLKPDYSEASKNLAAVLEMKRTRGR